MALNVKLLKKVRDAIADEKNPVGFDMETYGTQVCGTAACIGGHAILIGGKNRYRWEDGLLTPRSEWYTTGALAAELLGLACYDEAEFPEMSDDAMHLFHGEWTREHLYCIKREAAVEYLDECIAARRIVR